MRRRWRPIKSAIELYKSGELRECEVLLTQHEDDLYPVGAYLMGDVWFRAIEGPEDTHRDGMNEAIYRTPTHWMVMPESPKVEDARLRRMERER